MIGNDSIRVTTILPVDAAEAFRIFTEEIDVWWKGGPRYRLNGGAMRFESGQLLEGNQVVARVLAWEPGLRLLLEWRAWTFRPGEVTEVEVRFEPAESGTRVTVEHRGWEARPNAGEFRTVIGLWWGTALPELTRFVSL